MCISNAMLVMLQNKFLAVAQQGESPQNMPVHLLMHSSMERYLLESNPFSFDTYIYAQAASDAAPVEFHLDRLTQQLCHDISSKRFITNTLLDMHTDFSYKPSEAHPHGQFEEAAENAQLPAAFAVPLSTQQLTLLQTHCSHAQLEELQQASTSLATVCELVAAQREDSQAAEELLPTGFIHDAVAMLEQGQDQQATALPQRPRPSFLNQQGLQLAHLQPVRDFLVEQYRQQGYQFADVSPLLKAPLHADAASALRLRLAQGCSHSPDNRQALAELVAALRGIELEVLPGLANQGASLQSVCEEWQYKAVEFPLSAMGPDLACSQYAAVMRVMLQVYGRHRQCNSTMQVQGARSASRVSLSACLCTCQMCLCQSIHLSASVSVFTHLCLLVCLAEKTMSPVLLECVVSDELRRGEC